MPNVQTFDYSIDLAQVLLWQYDNAPRLKSLIEQKQAWYAANHSAFWSDWYRDVFNLQTANEFGLSVWGIILGLPPIATATPADIGPSFGFDPYGDNFFESNFGPDPGGTIVLTLEEKRLVLKLRYFQLVTRGAIPEINAFLKFLFADQGRVYVLDGLNMTIEYVFLFFPSARLLQAFTLIDILPRPAGVGLSVLINPSDSFGFAPYYLNFHNSNFGA